MSRTVTSRFVLKGDNQLNSAFSKAGQQIGRMGKAATIAGVALGAMVARSVIKNTIEQEKAVAQLNAALKSTGRYTPEASQALQDHAAALQQVSTYGDEAVIKAQNLLLTFRNIGGDAFPRATQAVLDTATAMGTDLKSAAIQLGKALNDPKTQLSALSRSGITFSESQKKMVNEMVEANNMAGAQAIILKELETQFGGSAKAARDTLGGALEAVKNNFGDLLEVTGEGKDGVTGALNELADTLARPEVKEGFQNLAVDALNLLAALAQLPQTFGFLSDEVRAFFGIIDDDDFVRLDDHLADLKIRLTSLTTGFFEGSGDFFESKVKELTDEIARTEDRIAALQIKPIVVTAEKYDRGGLRPAPDSGDEGGGGTDESASQKLIEKLQFETSLIGLSNTAKEQAIALRNLDGAASAEEATQISQLIEKKNELLEVENASLEFITVTAEKYEIQLSAGSQLIEQLEFERTLIGLTNDEREIAIALRGIETDATAGQIEKARELMVQNQELAAAEAQRNATMGILTNSVTGFFTDMQNGTKSAKEAFSDMAKSIIADIAKIIIQQAIMAAFGQGSGPGGSFSLAGMFGGGHAAGGLVSAGMIVPVNELGPELLNIGSSQYLMMGKQSGTVTPNSQIPNSGQTNITNIMNLPPTFSRRTAQQLAQEVAREQTRADSRNR